MRIRSPVAILALLTALNFLNYVDRYLVAAVSPAFQEKLGLSNAMTGFVTSAFMLGYFLTSPVFGRLADRRDGESSRARLLFVGVLLWSIATVASGLAPTGAILAASRVGVGIGEASYATIAPTLIDDLAPPEKKNRWLAVFYLATPVGSALGYVLGGILEHRFGWRGAFFVAGGPGVLLAFTVLLVREPARAATAEAAPTVRAAWEALRRAPLYLACVAGLCMYTFALGGFAAWAPKFLYQTHALPLAKADFGFGTVAVLGGIVGTFTGGFLADRGMLADISDQDRLRRYLRFSAIATAVAVPTSLLTILAPSPRAFFVWIFVCEAALFASTSPINAVILGAVPSWLRATAMAVSIFAIHAFGDFPSPPLIGKIADHATLRSALYLLPVAIAGCVALWWFGARLRLVDERRG